MKHKKLERIILIGLAMEMAACTTGMAVDLGAILSRGDESSDTYDENYKNNIHFNSSSGALQYEDESVTITNTISTEAAIQLSDEKDVSIITTTSGSSDDGHDIVLNSAGSGIEIKNEDVTLTSSGNNIINFNIKFDEGKEPVVGDNNLPVFSDVDGNGIIVTGSGTVKLKATGSNVIRGGNGDGIQLEWKTKESNVELNAVNNEITAEQDGIHDQYKEEKNCGSNGNIILTATTGNNTIHVGQRGIHHEGQNNITLTAIAGDNDIKAAGHGIYLEGHSSGTIALTGNGNTIFSTENSGIYITGGSKGAVRITAEGSTTEGISNTVTGKDGIHAEAGSVEMQAAGTNVIKGGEKQENNGIYDKGGTVSLNGYKNEVSGGTGIQVESGKVSLEATGNNEVTGHANYGITAQAGTVDLISKATNIVSGGNIITSSVEMRNAVSETFGDGYAVHASGESGQEQTKVTFSAANQNQFFGAVYASGNASVEMGFDQYIGGGSMGNYVASSAVIGKSEALKEDIVSALYAGNGASITVKGTENTILSSSASTEKSGSGAVERTVWASKGGSIEIDGKSIIEASQAGKVDVISIAMAAGTGDWDEKDLQDGKLPVLGNDAIRSTITLNYESASQITGDVVSGYGGKILIAPHSAGESYETGNKLIFKGNALASNGGQLTIDLGNNGYWEGRADSYKDADFDDLQEAHNTYFAPEFSKGVLSSGTVNVNMGKNSYWNVTGQSWVSSLSGSGIIDMRDNTVTEDMDSAGDFDASSHAVHIGKLSGDHIFIMDLNADQHNISDMLYIYDTEEDAGREVHVQFNSINGWEGMKNGEKLRFATVNADESELTFSSANHSEITYLRDLGIKDMAFTINNEEVTFKNDSADEENKSYNGESFNEDKPGNAFIEDNYSQDNSLNWYLVKNDDEDTLSDAGQTVIDMSRVNYSNAVYMDRLNKRMGEARYIDGDDGLWVRLRHDRIGKEDAFRSMNTMFELGYDRKVQDQKDGEHRRGVAFDYMRGEANYTNVTGSGDVRRAGVWLYDTWLGDKGHYSDYVLKYGRLSNDFDIFARTSGNKISGDYDNDVWSASAEYGRKKDIGNEWYFEPQAQLQYAYVTSADYTTSQGTRVELDGIDSLIGRAGFRLGRDTSEGNTVYFKADILHEFLGDQSIRAMDDTGVLSTTYDNEGTWYDVGLGFSHRMGEDSYMFLDVEHSFGNDNEDTYQINIGLNRAF